MSLERRDPFARRLLVTAFSCEAISRPKARKSSDSRNILMSGTPNATFSPRCGQNLRKSELFRRPLATFGPFPASLFYRPMLLPAVSQNRFFRSSDFRPQSSAETPIFAIFVHRTPEKWHRAFPTAAKWQTRPQLRPIALLPIAPSPRRPITRRPITQRPIVPSSTAPRVGAAALASRTGAPAVASRAGSRTHIHARGQPGRSIARARRRTPAVSSTMVARVSMAQEPTSCREELPPCPTRGRAPTTAPSSGW